MKEVAVVAQAVVHKGVKKTSKRTMAQVQVVKPGNEKTVAIKVNKPKGAKPTQEETRVRYRVLSRTTAKPESKMTSLEKMELMQEGVTKIALEELKEKTGLDYNQLAEVFDTSRATLISKKGNSRFNKGISEKIVSLAGLYSYGYEVFGDIEDFNDWIFSGNRALGGKMPFEFLNNEFGREEVKKLIGRIAYGVYS